jgi:hypothetical protein
MIRPHGLNRLDFLALEINPKPCEFCQESPSPLMIGRGSLWTRELAESQAFKALLG